MEVGVPACAIHHALSASELAAWSQRSTVRVVAQIAFEWTCLIGMCVCAVRYDQWWLYLLAIPWNGSRMHALGVLNHEGVHFRIHRIRWVNDAIADVLCAWPVFLSLQGFRRVHLAHHAHPNSDLDPDWQRKRGPNWTFPMRVQRLAWLLGGDLLLYRIVSKLREVAPYVRQQNRGAGGSGWRWLTYLPVVVVLVVYDLWLEALLLWVLPFLTWANMTAHLRSISDHFAIYGGPLERRTRTLRLSLPGRFFLMPNGIHYHCEHHAYPSVPFFRLPALHRRLMADPRVRSQLHVTNGVSELLREIAAPAPAHTL